MHTSITVKASLAFLLTTFAKLINCQRYAEIDHICTAKEIQRAGCINGKCYIVLLNMEREASCICDSGYAGSKCQELNLELIAIAKPNIYLIVGVVILVLIVAAIIFLICYRRVKGLPLSDVFSTQNERHLVPSDEEHAELTTIKNSRQTGNGRTHER